MPRRLDDSTADIFEDDDQKVFRSAKKARRGKPQSKCQDPALCRRDGHPKITKPETVEVVPLINSMAPAAARNQRDSYAGRRSFTIS